MLIYGWLDDLGSDEIDNVIGNCAANNQILIAYSEIEMLSLNLTQVLAHLSCTNWALY